MSLRLPCGALKPVNLAVGSLYFNDGSQKSLAGFIVWIILCLAFQSLEVDAIELEHPSLVALVSSLLRVRTVLRASTGVGDEVDNAISRIVKQNIDSKVQPVSSLAWAAILSTLGEGVSFDQAIAKYNMHPEVQAFEKGDAASGTISIDGRKRQAGWMPLFLECFALFCLGRRPRNTR